MAPPGSLATSEAGVALRVAREEAADVNLVSRSGRQFEEVVGGVEMPLGRKIVVERA